ncbi:MAG: M15 family metallopeptidase [Pseudohongiellaceae bacterium]
MIDSAESYRRQVQASHKALGIAPDYASSCGLPLCREPTTLADTEKDFYNRPQRLTPEALAAWQAMRDKAAADGVVIHLISAFRSLQQQHQLIAGKLEKGQSLANILCVNAAPGYSEHHTGRAVDLGTSDCPALQEKFDKTEAFQWLAKHAPGFGFHLSYPPDNRFGIIYEPWHWCFKAENES